MKIRDPLPAQARYRAKLAEISVAELPTTDRRRPRLQQEFDKAGLP